MSSSAQKPAPADPVRQPAAQTVTAPPPSPPVIPPLADPGLISRLSLGFQPVDYTFKGYHLDATVAPDQVMSAALEMDREGFALDTITGVDWIAQAQLEVVYDFFHPINGIRAVVRSRISRENPEMPTISSVYPGANWHERETHDFFGICFLGHPNLTPFLLPEDATYHPLRKDFTS